MEKVGIDDSLKFQIVFMFTFSQVNVFQNWLFSSRHFINSLILKSQFWNEGVNKRNRWNERPGWDGRSEWDGRTGWDGGIGMEEMG